MCSDFDLILKLSPPQHTMTSQQHQQGHAAVVPFSTNEKRAADDEIEFVSSKPVKKPRVGHFKATESRPTTFTPGPVGTSQPIGTQPSSSQDDGCRSMIAPVLDMSLDSYGTPSFSSFAFSPPLSLHPSVARVSEAISPRQLPEAKPSSNFLRPQPSSQPLEVFHPPIQLDQISCIDIGNFNRGPLSNTTNLEKSGQEAGSRSREPHREGFTGGVQHERDSDAPFELSSPNLGLYTAGSIASTSGIGEGLRLIHRPIPVGYSPLPLKPLIPAACQEHPPHTTPIAMTPFNHSKRFARTTPTSLVPRSLCPDCTQARQAQSGRPQFAPVPQGRHSPSASLQQTGDSNTLQFCTNAEHNPHRSNTLLPPIRPSSHHPYRLAPLPPRNVQLPIRPMVQQQRQQQQSLQPPPPTLSRKKPGQHHLVDIAETVERHFPYAEFAAHHDITEDKVKEDLAAIILLPLLRGSEKRRAGKLAHDRVRDLKDLKKAQGGEQSTPPTVAGLMSALDAHGRGP